MKKILFYFIISICVIGIFNILNAKSESTGVASSAASGTVWGVSGGGGGGGGSGEANTSSNAGVGGVGIVLPKSGVDLPFKSINITDNKLTITNDGANNEVDIGFGTVSINDLSDVTITTPSSGQVLGYNGTAWVNTTSGGGSSTFTGLTDTPANYTGSGSKIVAVNAGETALEFQTPIITNLLDKSVAETISGAWTFSTSPSLAGATFTGDITATIAGGLDINLGTLSGDNFTVDLTSFVVQGDTGRVGIGTATPSSKLEVIGTVTATTFSGGGLDADNLTDNSINDLSDVTITTPSADQLLKYNGVSAIWENWTPNYLTSEVDGSVTNELQNLFQSITDGGVGTATASTTTDSFKIRSADNLLNVTVTNDDVTYGDNALLDVNNNLSAYTNDAGFLTSETDPIVGAISGIVKADGAGNISAAVSGTDYTNIGNTVESAEITDGTIVNADIADSTIAESKLNIFNAPSDALFLQWDATNGMQWASVSGGAGGDITDVGDATTGAAFTDDGAGNTLSFEGATADLNEIHLTGADATADRTITLPDATGTVELQENIDTEAELETRLTDVTNVYTNNDGLLTADDLTDNSINDLSDVNIVTPSNTQVLKYNSVSAKWENSADDIGTDTLDDLSDNSINDLSDVTITTPAAAQYTRYNGTAWVNSAIQDADLPSTITRDTEWDTIAEIETATGVDIITSTENNDTLDDLSNNNLTDLSDVTITTPASGQVLGYNGTAWVNTTDDDVPEVGDFGNATDLDANGAIVADAVALGADTTGNYVATVAAGTGITVTGADGEGVTKTVSATFTPSSTDTLTNKTIDANGTGNVITNIDEDNMLAGSDVKLAGIEFVIDGGGSAITAGIKGDVEIPYNCTIKRVTMLADQTGSITVDLWIDTYANYPPTDLDSITAAAVPTITSANKSQDTTLTGWTTSLTAGSILRYNVDSATTITRCTVSLVVEK